jgi:hypothetical protein
MMTIGDTYAGEHKCEDEERETHYVGAVQKLDEWKIISRGRMQRTISQRAIDNLAIDLLTG